MMPEAVLDDWEERMALRRIQIHELSYSLRYSSLVNHCSSCYEGCQGDKCFQIHFGQVVLCFCLWWVTWVVLGEALWFFLWIWGGWKHLWHFLWHYMILPPGGIDEQQGLQMQLKAQGWIDPEKILLSFKNWRNQLKRWLKIDMADKTHDVCISFFKSNI